MGFETRTSEPRPHSGRIRRGSPFRVGNPGAERTLVWGHARQSWNSDFRIGRKPVFYMDDKTFENLMRYLLAGIAAVSFFLAIYAMLWLHLWANK